MISWGTFAEVYSVVDKKDGSEWACKVIEKAKLEKEDREALTTEVDILEKVDHPNIVRLRQVFDTKKTFYMVMERLTGGELFDRIVDKTKYTEWEAAVLVGKVVEGIQYCHGMGIAHRDLKPENILYATPDEDSEVKIADFGLGKLFSDEDMMATACGTPGYVAPEILQGEPYTDKVDLWSVGVITYILLCGFPPFYHENVGKMFRQIKRGRFDYPSPYWDKVSDSAKDLINHLLVVNPEERYSAADVLGHPWVARTREPKGAGRRRRRSSESAAGHAELKAVQDALRRFQARRRFRARVRAVTALARWQKMGAMAAADDWEEEEGEVGHAPPDGRITPDNHDEDGEGGATAAAGAGGGGGEA